MSKEKTFNESFKELSKIAEELRKQELPDIDKLVPMVEKATGAYNNCKSRLDAVKKALDEHLS